MIRLAMAIGIAAGTLAGAAMAQPAPSTPLIGTWETVRVTGLKAGSGGGHAILSFGEDGMFSGSDGCNELAGQYSIEGTMVQVQYPEVRPVGCRGDKNEARRRWARAFDHLALEPVSFQIEGDTLILTGPSGVTGVLRRR